MTASPIATATSPRERLLDAADELFYAEGVQSVGIDRIIERAGVAKASLYSAFGSKDELVRAYLERRHERRAARVLAGLERFPTPRARLLGVFDVLGELTQRPDFRGCAFQNARAETKPDSKAVPVCDRTRAWTRDLFRKLAADAGVPEPGAFARQLILLYDGAMTSARMDGDLDAPSRARRVAEKLLALALGE